MVAGVGAEQVVLSDALDLWFHLRYETDPCTVRDCHPPAARDPEAPDAVISSRTVAEACQAVGHLLNHGAVAETGCVRETARVALPFGADWGIVRL